MKKVFVAAFGKHPGWDDHIDDIGLDTDILVAAKRILYVEGIGRNIDSGSWDKLDQDQRVEGFGHVFVWYLDRNTVVGRMWSSRDGKGRSSYPMVVCVQCCQLPLEWIFRNIAPHLERIEAACVGTTSAAEVRAIIENARGELRQLVQQCESGLDLSAMPADALAKLAGQPEMGPDRQGLYRALYHIDREVQTGPGGGKDKDLRPALVRVPAGAGAVGDNALLWISFLLTRFGQNASVLVLIPLSNLWIDVVIGEPTSLQLRCLRANLSATPLASSIPYNMGPEFVDQVNQLINVHEAAEKGKA
ncbi:MAG: hypothetical protein ACYTEL_01965 [Planctomycetota bacterium]|jgi:hypothetical protein